MTEKEKLIVDILQANKTMVSELAYQAIRRQDFTTYFQFTAQKTSYDYMINLVNMTAEQLRNELGYKSNEKE